MSARGTGEAISDIGASTWETAAPPDDKGSSAARRTTFRSLRHRNYRLYFTGQLVSLIGSWVQTTALSWLAFEWTHSSTWPALVTAAQLLPTFGLGAVGGALADRMSKRRLLFATQSGLLILALALAGAVVALPRNPWPLLVISLLTGVVAAVDLPARLAFVMDMVGRDDLMNAVALNSLLFNLARAVGPALGGWLLTAAGAWPCFLVNGLSFAALLWALMRMDAGRLHDTGSRRSGGRSLGAGFRFLLQRPSLGFLFALATVLALYGWPVLTLLPAVAEHVFQSQARGYSVLLSGTGCGALAGAWTVATFGSWRRRRALITAGVGIISGSLVGLALAPTLPVGAGCCALVGFGLILFFATSQAVAQLSAADYNRGLLMGIWAMLLSGAVPAGQLLAGPAADRWGERPVIGIEGLASAVTGLGLLILMRLLKRNAGASLP